MKNFLMIIRKNTEESIDAMMIAIARIQAFGPRKYMLLRIAFSAEVVSICSDISRTFLKVWVILFQSDMYKIH